MASLMAWRKMVDETFANDLAAEAKAEASSSRGRGYGAECVIGEGGGYWATADDVTTGDVTLSWQNPQKINYVSIQEHIELGQRVRAFEVDVMDNGSWRKAAEGHHRGLQAYHAPRRCRDDGGARALHRLARPAHHRAHSRILIAAIVETWRRPPKKKDAAIVHVRTVTGRVAPRAAPS